MEKKKTGIKFIAVLFCILLLQEATAVSGIPAAHSLNITRYQQERSNWCWAASAQMVGATYNNYVTQSSIVRYMYGSTDNLGASDSYVTGAINFAMNYKYKTTLTGVLAFDTIKNDLALGRLVVIKMLWNSSGAHAVVCDGYTPTHMEIVDPLSGCDRQYYSYVNLVNGTQIQSGTGKYNKTWRLS